MVQTWKVVDKYRNKKPLQRLSVLTLIAVVGPINAASLDESSKVEHAIINDAQRSQNVVNSSAERSFELQSEIEALKAEIVGLEVYETHLNKLIDHQNQERVSIEAQLKDIEDTRQSIVPLMYQMLDSLALHIEQDMPIRKETRIERIDLLRKLMIQADISDAEKFRRIFEAYQIELDYVNKMGVYTSSIEIDGVQRETEQLYLGHISFITRSLDKQQYWVWLAKEKEWESLDSTLYKDLEHAFNIANKRASPTLLKLPLSVSQVSQ